MGTAANIIPRDDPATPGVFDGLVEVNHPGGGCWSGVTPDIRPGDVVQVLTAPGVGDQTTTANVTVTQPATKTGPGTVVMKGTAVAPGGGQYPIDQLEARIVAKNQSFVLGGKRTLRAGLGKEGSISYDGPGLTIWTATWTGLTGVNPADGLSDADRATSAVNSESRGMWLGIVPAAASENTTFEFAQIGGPTAPCTAPLAKGPSIPDMSAASDTGSSSTDNITRTTLPTFTGAVGLPDAASVNLYVDGTLNGSASVAANGSYSVTATTALTNGPHSITAGEVNAAGTATLGIGALTVTVDTTAPVMTGKAPALNTTGVSQASNVSATFSEPISGLSAARFTLKNAASAVIAAPVSWNAATQVATLNPTPTLAGDNRHTASLSAGITDLAGNPLAPTSWAFTTGPRPTVSATSPAAGATGVSRTANITATTSERVTGVNTATFALRKAGTTPVVAAVITYNVTTRVATLNPNTTLAPNTRYTATVSTSIRDAAGNSLINTSWSFTTGP